MSRSKQINNEIYETHGRDWWAEDAKFDFSGLRYCVNPVRYRYFKSKLDQLSFSGVTVLDVGCGGGFLAEEFAKDGFKVTGIDPSGRSIEAARQHAAESNLAIDYRVGQGEDLPFPDESFDIIACCDVLEHVDDPHKVICEAGRTLKMGGIFCYDTINRTWWSKVALVKIWQDWPITSISQPNVHVWDKFITPDELDRMLRSCHMVNQDRKGISPRKKNPLSMLWTIWAIRNGKIRNEQLAAEIGLRETDDLKISYMGYAIKDFESA